MHVRLYSLGLWLALALVCLTTLYWSNSAAQQTVATGDIKTAGGLTVVSFVVNPGTIRVKIPDDIRAGDTISGTVLAEPNGKSKEEQTANQAELKKFGIRLIGQAEDKPEDVSLGDISTVFKYALINDRQSGNVFTIGLIVNAGPMLTKVNIPLTPSGAVVTPDPKITTPAGMTKSGAVITPDPKVTTPAGMTSSGALITPDPKTIPTFDIPGLGQAGRPLVIKGPFDGNSSNTSINFRTDRNIDWDAVRRSVTDSEKNTAKPSGGFGLVAESPRKAVFDAPPNVVGAVELLLKEGPTEQTSEFRNVGINLSAPKTSLLKGEKTTLTIQVQGLEGIKAPVPLTLTAQGVITMEGGAYQPLVILPSQVGADGRYSTTRVITGVQTGGWTATATVVTHRFDTCLQDDSSGNLFIFDPKTGDYIFSQPESAAGKPVLLPWIAQTRGALMPTSDVNLAPPLVTYSGCKLDLNHKAPDRQVQVTIDSCVKTGQASVQAGKTKFTITDRNIADNTCFPASPK